ncbi:hypothetical protein NMD75_13505 [Edwardsiella tarda]
MSKNLICRLLWVTIWGVTSSVGASPHWDNTPTDESRRALQNSTRQLNSLLEQQTLQRLTKQQRAVPSVAGADQLRDIDTCLPISGVYLTGITLLSLHDLAALDALPTNCIREGANKRGNSSRLTQSFHFFMFEPIFSPVNALNQPI